MKIFKGQNLLEFAERFKTDDFSAKSLNCMFAKHIDINAKVTTDEWKGYKQIAKQYNITQIPSQ